ncbi:class I SAM-dependent methyltransferase [Desulforamulus ruminis]|uniref:Methyltransferase type 11 n=1 Tax=Desulforamulus ruminis (strain ATCC 23193 / DSM 2154 / NCIMB 8452 / DL) TaxID=696281 RepID=F6DPK8_DESRL|nr:class I SAM-dependent methyltransferase [Desulforamulus ruminis]AEG59585.1 Methyltransferase type 11 [Desulforamulus ruminis DSM 2154]
MVTEKGRKFNGRIGGAAYDRWVSLMLMSQTYYQKAIGDLQLPPGSRVLELGCGTGSLSIALAERADRSSVFYGVDIAEDQLSYARVKTQEVPCTFQFINCSMDELIFEDQYFDAVITSLALHETPPAVRRGAILETARVLKPEGQFILVDWSKPRFGLMSALWLPFLFMGAWRDNWYNEYRLLCEAGGLVLVEDEYINSLIRRQRFIRI